MNNFLRCQISLWLGLFAPIALAASPPKSPSAVVIIGSGTGSECTVENPILERTRFQKRYSLLPQTCNDIAEQQMRLCVSNGYTQWSGTFHYDQCDELEPMSDDGPLWQMSALSYRGGFRVDTGRYGPNTFSTADFSYASFTLSESKDSFYLVGNPRESQIGEFMLPEIVNTTDVTQMNKAQNLQPFAHFNNAEERFDTGISDYFRVSGMALIEGKLIVNYFNWYDASGLETDTTAVFQNPKDLANSAIVGPFQLQGAARSAGWVSEIPPLWQNRLGGTHISGWSQGSINSRLSNGPSGYIWSPIETAVSATEAMAIPTTAALTFPLSDILYDTDLYGDIYDGSFTITQPIMLNEDLRNRLWTYLSGATYGFIVPNSNTYVTLGVNGGLSSGIAYKYEYPDGSHCPGHCPKERSDLQNYYWLWRLSDLEKAVNGEMEPHQLRPYDYGEFDTIGSKARLAGGYFDAENKQLYVSLRQGDEVGLYARPPLFLVYDIDF